MSYAEQYHRHGDNRHAELTTSSSAPLASRERTCATDFDGDAVWQSGYLWRHTHHNRPTPPTADRKRPRTRARGSTREARSAGRGLAVGDSPSPTDRSPSRRRCSAAEASGQLARQPLPHSRLSTIVGVDIL